MREFSVENKIFIRSNNSSSKMLIRYTYALIIYLVFLASILLYNNEIGIIIDLLKTLLINTFLSLLFQYVINVFRKKKNFKLLLTEDNIIATSIIITLFSYRERLLVGIVATIITQIARLFSRNINISSSLYGILFVLIYQQFFSIVDTPLINFSNLNYSGTYHDIFKYGGIFSFIFASNLIYLSPFLAVASFIYLFFKKSIKYNLVLTYITTFSLIMLIIGFLLGMNIWFVFFQLVSGNILFLSIFTLIDYKVSPITYEGGVMYGIILAIITVVLRFIIPELSVVLAFIIGQLFLVKWIDKISYKLKYNHKFYRVMLLSFIFISLLVTVSIVLAY